MARPFVRLETGLFLALFLGLLVGGRSRLFGDPGSLWHIVVGERILSSRQLITADPFTGPFAGKPWIAQYWLAECGLALLHRAGGLDTVLLATCAVLAGLYTWVAHRLLLAGLHPLIALLITGGALAAGANHFHPRPHLLTLAFLAVTFARLCDFEAGRIPFRGLLWLVPLFVVWTNVHAGMMAGAGTVAVAVLGWGVARRLGWPTPVVRYRQLLPLGALAAACSATVLLNPYGTALPRVWVALMDSPVLPRVIEEHAPLARSSGATPGAVLVFGLVYLAALLGTLPGRPRVTWLIPLVWLALAWTRVRHTPLFAVTAALALGEMFSHVRWVAWLAHHGSVTCRIRPPDPAWAGRGAWWKAAALPLGLVGTGLLLQVAGVEVPVLGRGWASPDPRSAPVALLPPLREYQASRPRGTPVFNDMVFGGFLIYFTPDLRVFIDDRCELCGDRWLEAYVESAWHHPERIDEWAAEYGFERALVVRGSPFDCYLAGAADWALVGQTEAASLYRRSAAGAACEAGRDGPPGVGRLQ
jgi:hypothetical protein